MRLGQKRPEGRRRDVGPRRDFGEVLSRRIERRGAGLARRDDMAAHAELERELAAGRRGRRLVGERGLSAGGGQRARDAGQD